MQLVHRGRHRDHFLHHFAAHKRRDEARTRSGEEDAVASRCQAVAGLEQREEWSTFSA